MFPTWRLRLREARVAWQSGRYDEAGAHARRRVASRVSAGQAARARRGREDAWSGPATASPAATRRPAGRTWPAADRLGGQAEAISQTSRSSYADDGLDEVRTLPGRRTSRRRRSRDWKSCTSAASPTSAVACCRQIAQLMQEAESCGRPRPFCRGVPRRSTGPRHSPAASRTGTGTMDEIAARLERRSASGSQARRAIASG